MLLSLAGFFVVLRSTATYIIEQQDQRMALLAGVFICVVCWGVSGTLTVGVAAKSTPKTMADLTRLYGALCVVPLSCFVLIWALRTFGVPSWVPILGWDWSRAH